MSDLARDATPPVSVLTGALMGASAVAASLHGILTIADAHWPAVVAGGWALLAGAALVGSAFRDYRRPRSTSDAGLIKAGDAEAEEFDRAVAVALMRSLVERPAEPPLKASPVDTSVDARGALFAHHRAGDCTGHACPIHAPSDHTMKTWPLVFERDRKPLMSRQCPHGLAHPDPDALAYILGRLTDDMPYLAEDERAEARRSWESHHCDGCCHPAGGDPGAHLWAPIEAMRPERRQGGVDLGPLIAAADATNEAFDGERERGEADTVELEFRRPPFVVPPYANAPRAVRSVSNGHDA